MTPPLPAAAAALRLEGNGIYSSSYYPVAYQQHYTFSFSARADYEGAGVYAEFIGPKTIGHGVRVPKDRWERIVIPIDVKNPEGQVLEVPGGKRAHRREHPGRQTRVDRRPRLALRRSCTVPALRQSRDRADDRQAAQPRGRGTIRLR